MSVNNSWLPILGAAAAAAAVAAATLVARRNHLQRISHRFDKTRVKSWESEGGTILAPAK
jgi:hypothetical protein